MTRRTLTKAGVILLAVFMLAPSAFFVAPQRAHAQFGGPVTVIGGLGTIQQTLSAVANVAEKVNTYVLQPLAFATSGNLMKSMVAGMLQFIGGGTNGLGKPQFVTDLQGNLQSVGDAQTYAFLTEFGNTSNSPFADSIVSSLRVNYLQNTSLGGFFAANQCTLQNYSPNVNAYLAGDWKQGGLGAWFALTTQPQNNPYMLQARAQAELHHVINDATSARLNELQWSHGFLSWCGPDSTLQQSISNASASGPQNSVYSAPAGASNTSAADQQSIIASAQNATASSNNAAFSAATGQGTAQSLGGSYTYDLNSGNAPGDPCTNADGTPGTIQDPGYILAQGLNQAVGANLNKVIAFGNEASAQIDKILQDTGSILNTVNFATNILGGGGSGSGLASVGSTGSAARSALENMQGGSGYLGVSQSSVAQSVVQEYLSGVSAYETAWNTIRSAATKANTALTSVASACAQAGNQTEASSASAAQSSQVSPVLADAQQATSDISTARTRASQVQSGSSTADLTVLQNTTPTSADVAQAQAEAKPSGGAQASATDPLSVSGGTTVDRMNLLTQNANTLAANGCIVQ